MTVPQEFGEIKAQAAIIEALFGTVERWGGRTPLLARLMRVFSGNPVGHISAQSAGPNSPATLPDNAQANSAVVYVSDSSVFIRMDGSAPVANADQFVAQGSTLIITGEPSIKGFQFVAAAISGANLYGVYFD